MKQILHFNRIFILMAIFLWCVVTLVLLSQSIVNGASISEGFPSSDSFLNGTLVSIKNTVPTTVELADLTNNEYLFGVVETNGDSLLNFSPGSTSVNVATVGQADAFVTDVNGDISVGDFIGASWIRGVGMKANDTKQQKLLGIALENFDDKSTNFISADDIETPEGNTSARIGKITVRLFDKEVGPDLSENVSTLENFASRIAGKDVSFARVIAAAALFIVATIVSGIFLANAIHGSFISIGRNPLSGSTIFNSLMQVSGVAVSLLLIGAVIAYIVLVV